MKVLSAAALTAVALLVPCTDGPAAPANEAQDPVVVNFTNLANAVRANEGCGELVWYEDAAAVARAHSADMQQRGFFSHTNPEGKNPFDRLADAGVEYRSAAENILQGEATASRALELWIRSPGHRANLLNCSFTHHGVGRVDQHWTHIFLRDPS